MTKEQAERLAARDRNYSARYHKKTGEWFVWDAVSDHEVEFDWEVAAFSAQKLISK
jgi:hypothetical protein